MEDPLAMLDSRRGARVVVSFTDGHAPVTGVLESADEHVNILLRSVDTSLGSGGGHVPVPLRLFRGEQVKRIDFV